MANRSNAGEVSGKGIFYKRVVKSVEMQLTGIVPDV
jgi:hypothetical protein